MSDTSNIQFRHLFKILSGSTPESGKGFYWDGDIYWVTPEDVSSLTDDYRIYDTKRKITEQGYENSGVKIVPKNSIVLTKRAPIGLLAILGIEACSNQGCFLLVPKEEVVPEFYYYYLLAKKEYLQILGRGSTFMELSPDDLKPLKVPYLTMREQSNIAEFLDRETKRIDDLIKEKESQLAFLSEKRQALITQAVTKGINPNIWLKDSQVDWLGEIPEHWRVKKLKYIVEKIDEIVDEADFIIAVENIESATGKLVDTEKEKFYEGSLFKFQFGDVIFNKLRPYLAKVYLADKEGACVGELLILRGNEEIIPEFLFFRMLSVEFISQVNSSTVGAKMPRANWDDFIKHIKIGLPTIEEQIEIANFISTEQKAIQKIYDATIKSIELLKERKTSLITSAVTGKLKIANENT